MRFIFPTKNGVFYKFGRVSKQRFNGVARRNDLVNFRLVGLEVVLFYSETSSVDNLVGILRSNDLHAGFVRVENLARIFKGRVGGVGVTRFLEDNDSLVLSIEDLQHDLLLLRHRVTLEENSQFVELQDVEAED